MVQILIDLVNWLIAVCNVGHWELIERLLLLISLFVVANVIFYIKNNNKSASLISNDLSKNNGAFKLQENNCRIKVSAHF